jgi:hypothetical protein
MNCALFFTTLDVSLCAVHTNGRVLVLFDAGHCELVTFEFVTNLST